MTVSLVPSGSCPVPARGLALVLASRPLPHLCAGALGTHSSALPLSRVGAASIRICCTCPRVSHTKESWELTNLSLLSFLQAVSAAWFLHEINNIFPSMNISPLLFAVFSGGVVLCQPSLCSSQSWEIKCLQQYCAGVMLNQHAGLASVNPNVSRQRLFSEQRSQGWSQGDLCDCQMESRSLNWWRNLPTFLLWYAHTLLRKGRAADRSEKIAPKWELAQRHLVDLWGVHSNVKLLHEWWKCRASHGTCDTVSYASASGLLIYEEYVQTDWNKACSWTNGGESLFPPQLSWRWCSSQTQDPEAKALVPSG